MTYKAQRISFKERTLNINVRSLFISIILCLCTQQVYGNEIPPGITKPIVGEKIEFRGRWMGIPVGLGSMEVKEITTIQGREAYHIVIVGETNRFLSKFYPIHDEIHSYIDIETLQPLRFEKDQSEGNYRAHEVVTFDRAQNIATYESLLNGSVKEIEIPDEFHDIVSVIYWFRFHPLVAGESATVNIYADEKVYPTNVSVGVPVPVEILKRGTFTCFQAEPHTSFKGVLVRRGRIWSYFSADKYRIPLIVKMTTPWGQMSAVIEKQSIRNIIKEGVNANSLTARSKRKH